MIFLTMGFDSEKFYIENHFLNNFSEPTDFTTSKKMQESCKSSKKLNWENSMQNFSKYANTLFNEG